jgi:hypothetical protein
MLSSSFDVCVVSWDTAIDDVGRGSGGGGSGFEPD